MTTIPCRRPKVTVEPRPGREGRIALCHVPGCGWTYPRQASSIALKTDAELNARMHRGAHQSAVPLTEMKGRPDSTGHVGSCACGWETAPGVVTLTDVMASVAHHLSAEHGLVTC